MVTHRFWAVFNFNTNLFSLDQLTLTPLRPACLYSQHIAYIPSNREMSPLKLFSATLLVLVTTLVLVPSLATAADLRPYHSLLEARYARAHSLGDNYQFNTQDGWMAVNISNLAYKYKRDDSSSLDDLEDGDPSDVEDEPGELVKRASKKSKSHAKSKTHSSSKAKPKAKSTSKAKPKSKPKTTTNVKSTSDSDSKSAIKSLSSLQKIVDSIKGIGKAESVAITWYASECFAGRPLSNQPSGIPAMTC